MISVALAAGLFGAACGFYSEAGRSRFTALGIDQAPDTPASFHSHSILHFLLRWPLVALAIWQTWQSLGWWSVAAIIIGFIVGSTLVPILSGLTCKTRDQMPVRLKQFDWIGLLLAITAAFYLAVKIGLLKMTI